MPKFAGTPSRLPRLHCRTLPLPWSRQLPIPVRVCCTDQARAAKVRAEGALRDAKLEKQLSDIEFMREFDQISTEPATRCTTLSSKRISPKNNVGTSCDG